MEGVHASDASVPPDVYWDIMPITISTPCGASASTAVSNISPPTDSYAKSTPRAYSERNTRFRLSFL